ncbi:Ltv1 protein [Saccharomycopsis crataegensis]|uniref:Ltv1 protein n=1 Tax=Saccharomycopsis crataegensis TaxID=43959 RepID=A0AAV5QDU7_9ASCO|nr:Ltv1 protein [Saccharomycopsis crataegensis]
MSGRNTRKWVDKKNAQTFAVVYRSHEDSKFHDEDASENVLMPIGQKNKRNNKIKTKSQLEKELDADIKSGKIRGNEGEAALYGITYDDSKYDYMQHFKTIGGGNGVFIPKKEKQDKNKLNEILFKEDLLGDAGASGNGDKKKVNYQTMQNIPDEIAGFKPDMDYKLREVLEALEDEEYVDDDENVFNDLLQGGERSEDEFDDEDEWDMDNFDDAGYDTEEFEKEGDQGWEAGFRKFQAENKSKQNDWDSDDEFEEEDDVLPELPDMSGANLTKSAAAAATKKKSKTKERKKKGAMTDTSSFSMSSSALFRTEGLSLLDDRFEKLQLNYDDEDEEEPAEFDMSTQRQDFENMLDDFLDNHELEKGGRRIVKKDAAKTKLQKAADSVSRGKLAKKRNKKIVI